MFHEKSVTFKRILVSEITQLVSNSCWMPVTGGACCWLAGSIVKVLTEHQDEKVRLFCLLGIHSLIARFRSELTKCQRK